MGGSGANGLKTLSAGPLELFYSQQSHAIFILSDRNFSQTNHSLKNLDSNGSNFSIMHERYIGPWVWVGVRLTFSISRCLRLPRKVHQWVGRYSWCHSKKKTLINLLINCVIFENWAILCGKNVPDQSINPSETFLFLLSDAVMFLLTERRLISTNRLIERRPQPYFMHGLMDRRYLVEDDHIPFLERSKYCSK